MDLLSITQQEQADRLEELGQPRYRASQLCAWIYQRRAKAFDEMTDLPAGLRAQFAEQFTLRPLEVVTEIGSTDTTRKFLFRLTDGQMIEAVLIPASPALYGERSDRRTACISSQVGCAFGCKFCASGLDGVKRNLTAGEIVAQFLALEELSKEKINNVVFMGMGEPFANYENLMRAIGILNAPWGIGLGARNMTVSTSGLVQRIRDFADQPLQVRLAISLHAATDAVRTQIMPINRKYPLPELLAACAHYCSRKNQRLTFEYILIRDLNDTEEQAQALASHARRLQAKVNLIPYNRVEGLEWERPAPIVQERFLKLLKARGVAATLRREKGHDIAAACGQLRLQTVGQIS
ncbi:MAG TPA: 23S rRNA (adenine(2503)-C(2))-methyltransferase RlmN [Terrimicrobiaceae bacterium]